MAERNQSNSTDYEHPQESNLLNVHKALAYNAAGEPILRVNGLTDAQLRATPPAVILHGTTDSSTTAPVKIDSYGHELVVMSKEHHMIHAGLSFRYGDSLTLGSGASQVYLFNTDGKYCHFTLEFNGTAVTTLEIFEGSDRTGNTVQPIFNANRNSAITSNVVIHKGINDGSTDGVSIFKYASGSSQGNTVSTSTASFDNELILKTMTKYLIRLTSGTAGNLCNVQFRWYEV